MGDDWSESEVNAIIGDYFDMLLLELEGKSYNKAAHCRALAPKLPSRSKNSIEFKHANISAVLVNLKLPYIDGYKPRWNYQTLLAKAVEQYTAAHQGLVEKMTSAKIVNPTELPQSKGNAGMFENPPDIARLPQEFGQPWVTRQGRMIDFASIDAANRQLGKLGEEFVYNLEKRRLLEIGRDDLAARVEWVSTTCGDGVGFDVLSYNEANDQEKFVEVKATGLGKFHPFYVSFNEVRCSEAVPEKFHLYRVFNFSTDARIYVLPGALSQTCTLQPVQYRASL